MFKHWLFPQLLLETPGTGSGGGGTGTAGGTGGGVAAGGTAGGTGTAAGTAAGTASAGATAAPFEFRDDAQLRLPDGRIVTGRDYRDELSRSLDAQHQQRYSRGYELLLQEARRIDALSRTNGQGARQPAQDPLADIRNMPIVDGQSLARVVELLNQQGLGPVAQVVRQLQQQVQQQEKLLQQTTQRFGSQDEDAEAKRFEQRLDSLKIDVKGLNGPPDFSNPALRTIARNLFLSYVPSSWKAGEFEQQLGNELTDLLAAVREMDRKAVFDGKEKLRQHFNPQRGGATPSGGSKYKFETPREIAAKARDAGFFGGSNPSNT